MQYGFPCSSLRFSGLPGRRSRSRERRRERLLLFLLLAALSFWLSLRRRGRIECDPEPLLPLRLRDSDGGDGLRTDLRGGDSGSISETTSLSGFSLAGGGGCLCVDFDGRICDRGRLLLFSLGPLLADGEIYGPTLIDLDGLAVDLGRAGKLD